MRHRSDPVACGLAWWMPPLPGRPDAQASVFAGERASSLTSHGLGRGWLRDKRTPLNASSWERSNQSALGDRLKSECKATDESKCRKSNQTSRNEPSAVVSSQFRHFRPPSFLAKRKRRCWSSPRAAPTRQPGGVHTPGPARPSAKARTLDPVEEKRATVWPRSPRKPKQPVLGQLPRRQVCSNRPRRRFVLGTKSHRGLTDPKPTKARGSAGSPTGVSRYLFQGRGITPSVVRMKRPDTGRLVPCRAYQSRLLLRELRTGAATTRDWVLLFPISSGPVPYATSPRSKAPGLTSQEDWLSKQCARKLAKFQQPWESVNRSLLGVPMERPRHFLIRVERVRRGLTLRREDPRAFRLLSQQLRRLTCSARAARRRGVALSRRATPSLARRAKCVRSHWPKEQRAPLWCVPALANLASSPGCAGSPPQDSEYSQERPPKRVGGLVRDDSEDDADHDTDQRDEISDAQSHVASPLCRRPGN
jgi:hypothetical protein